MTRTSFVVRSLFVLMLSSFAHAATFNNSAPDHDASLITQVSPGNTWSIMGERKECSEGDERCLREFTLHSKSLTRYENGKKVLDTDSIDGDAGRINEVNCTNGNTNSDDNTNTVDCNISTEEVRLEDGSRATTWHFWHKKLSNNKLECVSRGNGKKLRRFLGALHCLRDIDGAVETALECALDEDGSCNADTYNPNNPDHGDAFCQACEGVRTAEDADCKKAWGYRMLEKNLYLAYTNWDSSHMDGYPDTAPYVNDALEFSCRASNAGSCGCLTSGGCDYISSMTTMSSMTSIESPAPSQGSDPTDEDEAFFYY